MTYPQNTFISDDNFQEVSFPQGVTPPGVEPDVDMMCVKYNPAWAQVLMAACSQLTQTSAWKGTDDEKRLAVARATNLKIQLQLFEDCDMSCCDDPFGIPVLHRVTSDGTMQISKDGGTTWVNDATDPRLTQPTLPPISGSGDLSCQAASNIVAAFKPVQHDLAVLLTGTVALLALSTAIAGIIAALIFDPSDFFRLVPVVISFAQNMVSLTETDYNAAFTDAMWHALLCSIQCTIGSDGIFTDAEVAALRTKMATLVTDAVVLNTFNLIVTGVGTLGLNNMGSQPATEEDCTDCSCSECLTMDAWGVLTNGSELTRTATSVTIAATVNSGHYYLDFSSHISDFDPATVFNTNCCNWRLHLVSGTLTNSAEIVPCPGSYNVSHAAAPNTEGTVYSQVWLIEFREDAPFTIEFISA